MEIFAPFLAASPSRPFVVGQLGQSLDGRIATLSGDARDIGGLAGLDHLHALRAHVDAVVVGASTILADDPQLTVRRVPGVSPARVVIDPRGRIGEGGRWLAPDGARRLLITAGGSAPAGTDEIISLERTDEGFAPERIVAALYERGLKRVLIEGGAITLSRFIQASCLDRLHVVVSPLIIGSGKSALDLPPISTLAEALRPPTRVFHLGGSEVLFDCDLRSGEKA
jgi:diaminohydroxyphosphoribosylaminopyrimidine deaminase/5-amino-6-(5-phosphoribosylamino)uracil reductase